MKIIADTNILLRASVGDDPTQERAALSVLANAELVVITTEVFCELCWVLGRGYRLSKPDIAALIRRYTGASNVAVDRGATDAGLTILDLGGDFADGTIAHRGAALGGKIFMSFDAQAVRLLQSQNKQALTPT